MKEFELTEKTNNAHKEYDPVSCGEDVSIGVVRDIKNESYSVDGNIDRKGRNIGRYVYDEQTKRVFFNCDTSDIKRSTAREIIESVTSLILQLIPENDVEEVEVEAEAEAPAEE